MEEVPKSPNWNDDPVPLTLDLLKPKSSGCDSIEDYYCAKFEVILISGFRFIVLT